MVKINESGDYLKMFQELCLSNEELENLVLRRILWFKKNPKDTRLDNHLLRKNMEGKWAFSITDDIRVVYEWTNKTTVRFLAIGPHPEVYPS